ncbi:MAG TPA: DNA repair protein RadA [Candidatus Baltobacteraceae bacterium]|nr:DNA repair protein RadA [Candidatus Baltobacteraceae bacterium]
MPKHSHYECQQCGAQAPRWLGRCPDCGAWGSLIEVRPAPPSRDAPLIDPPSGDAVLLREVPGTADRRLVTGIGELDRVLGGGLVPGGVVLIGGDPGVGKSTLLLQAAAALAVRSHPVLYASGEESLAQISERGRRLGLDPPGLYLAAETALEAVLAQIERIKPTVAIVDSIQTVWSRGLEAGAGSLSQVREVAGRLIEMAKRTETGVWLIGHVTKDGSLAGPRALEHLVDTVIYFEGDRQQAYRILRATKNRFGPTDEIGVFEMRSGGLVPVENPSAAFLAERPPQATGCLVVATMEGTRPILLELQALVSPTGAALPRRVANGLDSQRVAMLLAVLEKRLHLRLATADVFLNVVGGLGIREPAADLGVMAAVLSSAREIPVEPTWAFFGEVGLGGEVRGVPQADKRLAELARLGFTKAIVPRAGLDHLPPRAGIETVGLAHVGGLAGLFRQGRSGETV